MRGRLLRRGLLGAAALTMLAGCGAAAGPSDGGAGADPDRLRQRAREALARYDEAVRAAGGEPRFVPTSGLTGQLGDWEPANGDNKLALSAGMIDARGPLPDPPRETGTVTWESGQKRQVPLLSAEAALRRLREAGDGPCPGCVPLEVTAARLSTARIATTRGPAVVPAWEFALAGTRVRLTRVAVADEAVVTVTPPPWDPDAAPGGHTIQSATTTVDARELTVTFVGSPGPASEPCGVDYTAEAVESATAVVVIVTGRGHGDGPQACPAIGATRTATAELERPLGERAVLEVQRGLPVPVTVTG
ncbi:hypothetical protein [Micromonospora globbae]|uniref:Lipoprotein n=1 Tax=Micromonospora globbae TaxID=1894969 RepID=A0ABZ1S1L3_9ACTN|nr:hypothetical protein [Micromonospora globbae]